MEIVSDCLSDGLLPGDGRELRLASPAGATHRAAQPVGVIERLDGRLAARAKAAAGDRVERIALDLLDRRDALAERFAVPLHCANTRHDAHQGAAPRSALAAHGGMPLFFAGYDFVLRHQQGNQLVSLLAAAAQCAG